MIKKQVKKIVITIIFLIVILSGKVFAKEYKIVKPEYTEIYKIWNNLPDEQKSKILEPVKYQFANNKTNEENILANKKITLNNLIKLLRASANSEMSQFSLRSIIENNLKIKDQKQTNWCWAFASISSLETNFALKNYLNDLPEKLYDYSEKHMVYSMSNSFLDEQVNKKGYAVSVASGGNYYMSTAYLTNGSGAIDESELPFDNSEKNIDISNIQGKKVQTTVNDIKFFDRFLVTKQEIIDINGNAAKAEELENLKNQMKEHICTSGSLDVGIHFPELSKTDYINLDKGTLYTCIDSYSDIISEYQKGANGIIPNHAVSIIGWNDNYDKANFNTQPKNNGAWIVRNSYGEIYEENISELRKSYPELTNEQIKERIKSAYGVDCTLSEDGNTIYIKMGDNGIFYISYEDAYVYWNIMGIEDADDKVNYDNIYQHDETGGSYAIQFKQNMDCYIANVYKRDSTDKEYLTSIGITSVAEETYEVYINPNGSGKGKDQLKKVDLVTGDNISLSAGYHTIEFEKPYELTGSNFVIAVKIIHKDGEYATFAYEDPSNNENITISNKGESFVADETYKTDTDWMDISNAEDEDSYFGNLCIKGIVINNYTGITANDTDVDDNPSDDKTNTNNTSNTTNTNNTTNSTNTTNTNNTTNTTNTANTTDDANKSDEIQPENSDYDNSNVLINNINVSNEVIHIEFEITGIQVKNNMDKYEHYFYITNDSNKTDLEEVKWEQTKSFEKQKDGTYVLKFEVTDISQINYEGQGNTLYVYIKELAYKGNKTATKIEKEKLEILTSSLNIDSNGEANTNQNEMNKNENKQGKTDYNYKDNTTINNSILPYTGIKTIIIIIGIIIFIFTICYIKYKKLYDIK